MDLGRDPGRALPDPERRRGLCDDRRRDAEASDPETVVRVGRESKRDIRR